jgi:hypothetical protein
MTDEWGPWIEHDGGPVRGLIPVPCVLHYRIEPPGILGPEQAKSLSPDWPGFFWRWKRVRIGWFRTELRRVCDQPEYAPIIQYRIRKPRGMAILERIVAAPAEKVRA